MSTRVAQAPDTPDQFTGYLIKQIQHAFRAELDETLRRHGLSTPQMGILSWLRGEPGLSGAKLARRVFCTPQSVQVLLAGMEADGLITRKPDPENARILRTELTRTGLGMQRRGLREALRMQEKMLAGLSPAERQELMRLLRHCRQNLDNSR